jgi:predicted AAA+ superfamily ATPase
MPHSRSRYAEVLIKRALTHSPIVGVLGHRQVGKSTLAESLSKEYITFDSAPRLEEATQRPTEFLENRKVPFTVDEAQLCPPLFPAAKEWVRVHPKKGQFIFTGSVRFTSRKMIRESLTGRIVNVEILPMTISEMSDRPLSLHLSRILKIDNPAKLSEFAGVSSRKRPDSFLHYLETGGLPGICFFRDETVRYARFEAHLDTLLNRDMRLVTATTLSSLQLRKLAAHLAETQGAPFELKAAATACQASTPTVKKILYAFEALFLIRPIPSEGTLSKISYFFEDQGLASYLSKNPPRDQDKIMRGVYANLRQELHYRPHPQNEVFSFRTHDGTDIPLAFKFEQGVVGVIASDERHPTLKAQASAKSFLKRFPKAKVVIACNASQADTRDFKTFVIPYWWLC